MRGVAYIALAGGLLAAAMALSNRQYPTAEASRTEPPPDTGALNAELAHCQAIGPEAANDGACKAIWEANRRRSFESRKLYRDRVTDAVPATPDVKEPAPLLGKELPRSAPSSPLTLNSSASPPPGDIAGPAQ